MRIRATAIVIKDNKILLIHRVKNGEEYWVLPGGSVEEGERVEDAVLRELREETSIEAKVGQQIFFFGEPNTERHSFYLCEYIFGEPALDKDSVETGRSGTDNYYNPQWVDINKIPELILYPKEAKTFLIEYLHV